MPYVSAGNLVTDKREIATSETWGTQTEWEAYQEANSVEIVNGTILLSEISTPASGVFRLTFDDSDTESGTALDVWNNNDGTINGAATGVSGANQTYTTNEAYRFDGIDDTVDVGTVFDVSAAHSIALWANFDTLDTNDFLYAFEDANNLSVCQTNNNGNSEVFVQIGNTTVASASLSTGTWYHICVTFNPSGNVTLYIDGSQSDSSAYGADDTVFGQQGNIGGEPVSAGAYEDADIDDPRAYSKELTSTEVSNLYNNGYIGA